MKKYLLFAGLCAPLFSTNALATDFSPYIGLDVGASHVELADYLDEFDDNFIVANLNAGLKLNNYFGLEISSSASSQNKEDGVKISYSSIGLDALGYLPLNSKTNLFALGGVGYYTFEAEQSIGNGYNMSITKNETAPRIGLGVQYDISEKISLRGVLKHAFINSDDVDSITELTVGIRYNF